MTLFVARSRLLWQAVVATFLSLTLTAAATESSSRRCRSYGKMNAKDQTRLSVLALSLRGSSPRTRWLPE